MIQHWSQINFSFEKNLSENLRLWSFAINAWVWKSDTLNNYKHSQSFTIGVYRLQFKSHNQSYVILSNEEIVQSLTLIQRKNKTGLIESPKQHNKFYDFINNVEGDGRTTNAKRMKQVRQSKKCPFSSNDEADIFIFIFI